MIQNYIGKEYIHPIISKEIFFPIANNVLNLNNDSEEKYQGSLLSLIANQLDLNDLKNIGFTITKSQFYWEKGIISKVKQ